MGSPPTWVHPANLTLRNLKELRNPGRAYPV